jgi:hypothetical protein
MSADGDYADALAKWVEEGSDLVGPCPVCATEVGALRKRNGSYRLIVHCGHRAEVERLLAMRAAQINGNGTEPHLAAKPASAREPEPEKRAGPALDSWKLAIHDRARHLCETLMEAGGIGADLLRTQPLEAFIATVNEQRNLPNDHLRMTLMG